MRGLQQQLNKAPAWACGEQNSRHFTGLAPAKRAQKTHPSECQVDPRAQDVAHSQLAFISQQLIQSTIINLALLAGGAWLVWAQFGLPWIRLVDHRVVKAPLMTLNWKELSAELEMHRDSEGNQWTRFVRFSAECPICSGKIELLPGKPEHRLPLVGRCAESPHTHVYSFDRTKLTGYYIGPRLHEEGV